MTMEHVEKDVISMFSNKRESFLGLYISFPWGYRGKNMNYYYQHLEKIIYIQKKLMNY